MWINVKDKKPEKMISALVIGANGRMLPQLAVFFPEGGFWRWSNVKRIYIRMKNENLEKPG